MRPAKAPRQGMIHVFPSVKPWKWIVAIAGNGGVGELSRVN